MATDSSSTSIHQDINSLAKVTFTNQAKINKVRVTNQVRINKLKLNICPQMECTNQPINKHLYNKRKSKNSEVWSHRYLCQYYFHKMLTGS